MFRRRRLSPRYIPVAIAIGVTACIGVPDTRFGQNKVQYDAFDFEILETEHFDIFFYEEEREAAAQAGRMAERWYARLTRLLNHELRGRHHIIVDEYENGTLRDDDAGVSCSVWSAVHLLH